MYGVGYGVVNDFVAVSVHTDQEVAKDEAWSNQTVRSYGGLFPGSLFFVLDIERPKGFRPKHLLDAPEHLEGSWISGYRAGEPLLRNIAMRLAHDRNGYRGPDSDEWSIVLEAGCLVECTSESEIELRGGVGIQCCPIYRPVRVVRFSPEEVRL